MITIFIKRMAIAMLCLVQCISVTAHTGSLKGVIKDSVNRKPMEGVSLYINTLNNGAVTDAFGHFFIKGIPAGKYTVTLSHIGYETRDAEVVIEDGVTTELSLKMSSGSVKMSEVSINSKRDIALGIISGVDLKIRPVNSTQDLMRLVPGLFTSQHQGGGKAEQIFLRGFDCDHGTDINVSVDGMPVNMVSHAHGQGFADSHFIIPELVKELDFGKGPYRIDKGNLATAGWVEFKTADFLDNNFIKLEGGSFGYARAVGGLDLLDKTTGDHRQTAYIAGEYGYNRSYFDNSQDFNRFNLVGKYTDYISSTQTLALTLSGFHTFWNASGQVPTRAVEDGIIDRFGELDGEGGNTSRYNMNIQYSKAINSNSYFKSNVYLTYYDFSLYSDFTYFLDDPINGDQIHQAEKRALGGTNNEYSVNYNVGKIKMRTQVGLGMRYDDIMDDELTHTKSKSVFLNNLQLGDIHEANMFGYVNQTVNLLPQLVVTLGTRFDYFVQDYQNHLKDTTGYGQNRQFNTNVLSPKAGIYYNFGNKARIYYNYGTGFHSNDTRTLALGDTKGQAGVIDHVLPKAESMDLGVLFKPYSKLLVSAAIWQLDLQQEVTYGGDGGQVEFGGRTHRQGFDLSVRYDLLKWLYIDGDLNISKSRAIDEPAGQDYVPLAAGFTSIGGLTFKVNKELTATMRYRHMGDRPANEDNSIVAPGYTVCDAVATYTKPRYEIGLQVQNLFNVQWREAQFLTETRLKGETAPKTDICYTPGTPFFIKLSATYKF